MKMDSFLSKKMVISIGSSTVLAFGCAAFVYYYYYKRVSRDKTNIPAPAFNYLKVHIVTTVESCDEVISELRSKCITHKAVGFDCEWVTENHRRKPVALLQLSTFDGYCGLFRLNVLKEFPNSLKDFLGESSIYKLGVACNDDANKLFQDYSVHTKSTLDLRNLAEVAGQKPGGLAKLANTCLGVILDKYWKISCSDWEAEVLTERQINYAAADAHVAIRIFAKLIDEISRNQKLDVENMGENIDVICKRYVDRTFSNNPVCWNNRPKENLNTKETVVKNKRYPHATRKSPLYHNCFLQAPDGEMLCTCDNNKALWYVEKGLADKVKDEPLTVRLRFEPAGRSVGDVGKFYQILKENKCVVCGSDDSYIRKNVVPREYRRCFPEIMKEHSSHDVVLLCVECHMVSNVRDQAVRAQLAERCGAPLSSRGENGRYLEVADCRKIRSAARALLHQTKKHKLPKWRSQELEGVLLKYYKDHKQLNKKLLKEAADLQVVYENSEYESHGAKVVEYYLRNGGLLKLEELWREHFLNRMCPHYLPPLWSTKHNEERLRIWQKEGRLSEEDIKLIGVTDWL